MKRVVILLLVAFCNSLHAQEIIESWECQENSYGDWTAVLVKALVVKGRTKGKIHVAGIIHDTIFEVKGFNRRWDFGLSEEGTYKFAFIVAPNGRARYYDFGLENQSEPSMFLYCRQK